MDEDEAVQTETHELTKHPTSSETTIVVREQGSGPRRQSLDAISDLSIVPVPITLNELTNQSHYDLIEYYSPCANMKTDAISVESKVINVVKRPVSQPKAKGFERKVELLARFYETSQNLFPEPCIEFEEEY